MLSLWRNKGKNIKGQATTEFAIMGAFVIMLLTYLLQQGFVYEARQNLEMYTFRQALKKSRQEERGISLTVIRDMVSPSLFSGISRQRLMASAVVEYNPWKLYVADRAQDVPTKQYLQVGDAMIEKGSFIEIPPTNVRVKTKDNNDWAWTTSSIKDMDRKELREEYDYSTTVKETREKKEVEKILENKQTIVEGIGFEHDVNEIKQGYFDNDLKHDYEEVEVDANTIPKDIHIIIEETLKRGYIVEANH
ncbi:MAG: hypothetical protein ABIH18_08165 [Candidatus Omnitrophota bacterium]